MRLGGSNRFQCTDGPLTRKTKATLSIKFDDRFAVHLLRRVQPPSIDAGAYESAGHRAGVLAVLE
jgi:hypothetical protein